jgi:hypothetical protein
MNKTAKFKTDVPSYELSTKPIQTRARRTSKILSICARNLCIALAFATLTWVAPCQEIPGTEPKQPVPHIDAERSDTSENQSRHILGVIPNYRTFPSLQDYKPLTIGQKFNIASEDSLDRGTFALAGAFGGLGQLTNSNKSFGHGAAGFGRYFGTSYGVS